jgi:hypothetical protein
MTKHISSAVVPKLSAVIDMKIVFLAAADKPHPDNS